jgi:hypothetical protein
MSDQSARQPAPAAAPTSREAPPAAPPARCATGAPRTADEGAHCPACGETMRLWANYHRCRNCGYKESCCF